MATRNNLPQLSPVEILILAELRNQYYDLQQAFYSTPYTYNLETRDLTQLQEMWDAAAAKPQTGQTLLEWILSRSGYGIEKTVLQAVLPTLNWDGIVAYLKTAGLFDKLQREHEEACRKIAERMTELRGQEVEAEA